MRIALGGGRAAAVLGVQQPLAALGASQRQHMHMAAVTHLDLGQPRAQVDHVLGDVHAHKRGANHLALAVFQRGVARHVIAAKQARLADIRQAGHQVFISRAVRVQRRAQRALAILLAQRGGHPQQLLAGAGKHRGHRAGASGKAVHLVHPLVQHGVVQPQDAHVRLTQLHGALVVQGELANQLGFKHARVLVHAAFQRLVIGVQHAQRVFHHPVLHRVAARAQALAQLHRHRHGKGQAQRQQ